MKRCLINNFKQLQKQLQICTREDQSQKITMPFCNDPNIMMPIVAVHCRYRHACQAITL